LQAWPVSFHENSLGIKELQQADVIRNSSYFVKNACIGYLISTDTHMIYSKWTKCRSSQFISNFWKLDEPQYMGLSLAFLKWNFNIGSY